MRATTSAFIAAFLAALLTLGSTASAQPGQPSAQPGQPAERTEPPPPPPRPPGSDQQRAAPADPAEARRGAGADVGGEPERRGEPAPFAFGAPNPRPEPNVELEELVRRVGEASGRNFLIHAVVPARIYVRGTLQETPTYAQLLSILRANGLGVFIAEDIVNIVPDVNARSMPTRVVQEDDDRIPDDEVVTRVIRTQHVPAAQLVPVLRPMMPQEAHLTAIIQSNVLLIVDRYANVKRITDVVRMMDVESGE